MRSLSTTPCPHASGSWTEPAGEPSAASPVTATDRTELGVEDQVEPLVELEPRAVLDVGLALLGPAARTLPPTVHVNLSPRQFAEPHLIDLVADALADTGTDPDRLCLEVTERALAANPASAATTLKRLSALGVRVSVDDFGTGYSSPASLQYLPLSSLKIDRSFVARLDRDPADGAMVAAVIGLGHTLGLTVIAEGVETPRELARLDQLGCDYAQG